MNLSPLKPLVYDAQKYNALMGYLEDRIARELKRLETTTDPIQIYQIQGRISAYRLLFNLRQEVINFEEHNG